MWVGIWHTEATGQEKSGWDVTAADGLKAGDKVEKGQVIATVAEANGNEYKDGAHLHFEVHKDGTSVDPASYLTLEEK